LYYRCGAAGQIYYGIGNYSCGSWISTGIALAIPAEAMRWRCLFILDYGGGTII